MINMLNLKKEFISFQVMLVGVSGAGKSSLILRYTKNKFVSDIKTTIGIDFEYKNVLHRGKTIRMELWDTSGQDVFKSIPLTRFKRCNGLIFVYDLTSLESFNELETYWIPTAVRQCPEQTVFAAFGNKSDLLNDPNKAEDIKTLVEHKLQSLSDQYKIEFIHFVGNCIEPDSKGQLLMMEKMVDLLYSRKEAKDKQEQEASRLAFERGQLPRPPRRSIVLNAQDFESNTQANANRTAQRRKCC